MTSQNGDQVNFERLETPRQAPKVTLKKNWQSQQQEQHSTSSTDAPSLWKQGTNRENQAGAQDVMDHSTEADVATRKLEHTTSNTDVDTHLGNKEVSTNAFSESEAVKEEIAETNTKAIERIRIGSNKICIRENVAKENMMFSQESSQAIFEMGNEELIELKTSRIQCPSCLHYVFKGTIICSFGKYIRPDQELIRRIKAAFYSYQSTLHPYVYAYFKKVTSTALTCCRNTTTKQKTHYRVRKRAEENLRDLRGVPTRHWIVRCFHKTTQEQRSMYHNLIYLRSVNQD